MSNVAWPAPALGLLAALAEAQLMNEPTLPALAVRRGLAPALTASSMDCIAGLQGCTGARVQVRAGRTQLVKGTQ